MRSVWGGRFAPAQSGQAQSAYPTWDTDTLLAVTILVVSVRGAQFWERDRELPVHRLPGSRGRSAPLLATSKPGKHKQHSPLRRWLHQKRPSRRNT